MTTTPIPPPVCINGGELLNGVCICPDQWIGPTCAIAGIAEASARCFRNATGQPGFEEPQMLDCGLTLRDINLSDFNTTNFLQLASSAQILTSRPEQLTVQNITTAAEIASRLLGEPNIKENVEKTAVNSSENLVPESNLHVEADRGSCSVVAALLQYFLLATFTWNALYGTHMVLLMRNPLLVQASYSTSVTVAIGWGLPALLVALTLAITYRVSDPLGYRQEEFCWLAALNLNGDFDCKKPMLWGFLLPVGLMLLCNTAVLVYFAFTTCKRDPILTSNMKSSNTKKVISSFSLAVVLGLCWILGYLMMTSHDPHVHQVFATIFCVFTTTQGVQIFILFTARTTVFKQGVTITKTATVLTVSDYH
ncbi:adhesion G-protein coupled receptor G7 [Aplochiton taeniatus]